MANHLPIEPKIQIIDGLCNGLSLRAASRVFNTHRTAIMRLLVRVGDRCGTLLEESMHNLCPRYLELDELWTFCGKKQGRLLPAQQGDPRVCDQYLFFAIDPETRVIPAWSLGKRTSETALDFLTKLHATLDSPTQIFTDGWNGYTETIEEALGPVDYAQVIKEYEGADAGRGRYAPPRVSSISRQVISGNPDKRKAGTSRIERTNWTVRTTQRRFTRLAAGFSRELKNLHAACALHFAYYNFVWQVRALKEPTPAMAAGAVSSPWNVADLVAGC
jgi:IS1 family transposase